ncbi:MAG: copper chaperone PCu(A)C [Gemmatimonadales bacterium]
MIPRWSGLLLGAALAGCHADSTPVYQAGNLTISRVVAPVPVIGGPGGVYFTITAHGVGDTLLAVTTPVADSAQIHATMARGEVLMMAPTAAVPIPAGATVRFAPGGRHVMLLGLHRTLIAGDSFPVELIFRRAGRLTVSAHLADYAHLDEALGTSGAP